ncbi:hypothetical protein SK128_013603, partial [Halocaridina rubra]
MEAIEKGQCATIATEDCVYCFMHLQKLWKLNKKNEFSEAIRASLVNTVDPYKLIIIVIKLCRDIYKSRGNGMAANIAVEFISFLNSNREKYTECLTKPLQKEVFQVAITQKNTGLMRLLVKAYELENIKTELLPYLHDMIAQKRHKDVCILATLLSLQSEFSTFELIIPLFIQDRLCLADEFLDSSLQHQQEIVLFIDDLIGKKTEAQDVLAAHGVKNPATFKSSKILSNTATRLLKRYKLDMALFPNLRRIKTLSALRYLFYKYYIGKGLQYSVFQSLIDDALKESPELKVELMNLFSQYQDPQSAVPYVARLGLYIKDLPWEIINAVSDSFSLKADVNSHPNTNDIEEEYWNEDGGETYPLLLPPENIIIVDTIEGFEECMKTLSSGIIVGVDTEWKPTFGIGHEREQVALLQLASVTHVFLIDVVLLLPCLTANHWIMLGKIFVNDNITKLGYGIKGDFKVLAKLNLELKNALVDAQNVIDFDEKKAALLSSHSEIFSFSASSYKGLSDLVYRCFGKPLNKNEQFSNWAERPLSKSQRFYAALDARCLIEIYQYLNEKAELLEIRDWRGIKPKAPSKDLKKSTGKKMEISASNVTLLDTKQSPILARDSRFVCDTMLQGLAKKLRLCGVDAIALENGQSSDECIPYFEKDMRVVLSRGSAYVRLSRYIPAEYLFHVQSE